MPSRGPGENPPSHYFSERRLTLNLVQPLPVDLGATAVPPLLMARPRVALRVSYMFSNINSVLMHGRSFTPAPRDSWR
jgi:hypothetical protein